MFMEQRQSFVNTTFSRFTDARQQRVREAAHRGNDDDSGARRALGADNAPDALKRAGVFDGGAAKLHYRWHHASLAAGVGSTNKDEERTTATALAPFAGKQRGRSCVLTTGLFQQSENGSA